MKPNRQAKEYAKQLLRISMDGTELSSERASAVLQALEANPPRQYLAVLRAYLKLVQREVARSTAVVYHAGEIGDDSVSQIAEKLSRAYGRTIQAVKRQDDDLIAGLRVEVDCDVYEASVASSLQTLQASLT